MNKKPFNRLKLRMHRNNMHDNWEKSAFLKKIASERLNERLLEVKKNFNLILDLGSHSGELSNLLKTSEKVKDTIQLEIAYNLAKIAKKSSFKTVVADEENIPFKHNIFDGIFSSLSFHWINEIPDLLIMIKKLLKSNGLFLANFLGGKTLNELQKVLIYSETKILGGSLPRVSPFIEIKDAGMLLQKAGFEMPVVDSEIITVTHKNIQHLFSDLRNMAENSCLNLKTTPLRRDVVTFAEKIYQNKYSKNQKIFSTFELITMTAWSPDSNETKNIA